MLRETLDIIKKRLQSTNLSGFNERNTDRVFVSPVLEALGWDLSRLDEVLAAYSIKGLEDGTEISYAFFAENSTLLLVEIRPLFSDLSRVSSFARAFVTARESPARFLVVTNGVNWNIYDVSANLEHASLIIQIDIRKSSAEESITLLTRSNIRQGGLDKYITENPYIDSKNNRDKLLKNRGYRVSDFCHDSVNRLRTQIMTNRDVKDQDITNSAIVENILQVFFESAELFNYNEISNEVILKMRIEEAFHRNFSV